MKSALTLLGHGNWTVPQQGTVAGPCPNRVFSFPLPVAGWLIGLGLLLGLSGCRNCDLVEAQLRSSERELRQLRSELDQVQSENEALGQELHNLGQSACPRPSPELATQLYTVKQVVLGRQTGGYDDDYKPGDEALQVVLEPRDADGQAIKAPGSLRVVALQISPEGLKAPLSSWELSPEQLRHTWRNGLLSTGYHVILPWKVWPVSDKLRVVAQFALADGRVFEADKDVTIRLPPTLYRKGPGLTAPQRESGPELLVPEVPPPPRPLEDKKTPGADEPVLPPSGTDSGEIKSSGPVLLLKPSRIR